MTDDVMDIWITNCFRYWEKEVANQAGLVFIDHHKSHLADNVIEGLKNFKSLR